ncbi:MAG: argininosuccinate lyase [Planctomycetota bacterium]
MSDSNPQQSAKSWQGRLKADADEITARFVASIDVDTALWRYDIAGSLAHAEMLGKVGILTDDELVTLKRALAAVAEKIEAGQLDMPIELEDIHMVIESALIDETGDVGRKLHTGRSRNDQIATDLRLWARDAVDNLAAGVRQLQANLVELARRQGHIVMPAYTHLQRAQPIVAGHAVLAYVEMLQRDLERLADARKRINVCPLGSGAVAGTSLPLNRSLTAAMLNFEAVGRNSIDATSDRDFLAELAFACSMLTVHLSRWAEDWIIYASTEFGFIVLNDAYCTSSSMMPQKKNPDTLELIRGKSATAIGQLVGLLTMLKGLPLAYNRDLQDDKRFAFACFDATYQALAVAAGVAGSTQFNEQRIARDLNEGFLDATALAEYLVNRGMAFRSAHHAVGLLVAQAEDENKSLSELSLQQFQAACSAVEPDVYDHLGPENVVAHYLPEGAGGRDQLDRQIQFWDKLLKTD